MYMNRPVLYIGCCKFRSTCIRKLLLKTKSVHIKGDMCTYDIAG